MVADSRIVAVPSSCTKIGGEPRRAGELDRKRARRLPTTGSSSIAPLDHDHRDATSRLSDEYAVNPLIPMYQSPGGKFSISTPS